jgi:MoaA/NifB/PqqE/SkfB family radical SAM enzyme
MCYVSKYKKSFLPKEKIIRILNNIRPYAKKIVFVGEGEPLLHPNIRDILEICRSMNVEVSINTNGILLERELSETIVSMKDFELKVSLDASTPQTYKKVRGRDVFEKILQNVKIFSELKDRSNNDAKLIFVYVVMRENISEVLSFVEKVAPFSPYRIQFLPAKMFRALFYRKRKSDGFCWSFWKQRCESFKEMYNQTMKHVQQVCEEKGLDYEITIF